MKSESIDVHGDARGFVFEPAEEADFPSQRNAHVVLTRPGGIRGNHRHIKGTEIITVMGPARVRYRENGEIHDVDIDEAEARRFRFAPGIAHAIQNTGQRDSILIAFNTEIHDPECPDTVSDVLIEPTEA